MTHSQPADGFRLSYADSGEADLPAVVLLHGWPGDRHDYRAVLPLLAGTYRTVVPDLRGFGESDRPLRDPRTYYGARGQAASVASLITELGLSRPVIAGYDVGSRVAQTLAAEHPGLAAALAVSPPLPGAGTRVLHPDLIGEFWYQYFHRSPVSVGLVDGNRDAVYTYLHYIWSHWGGPGLTVQGPEFDALVDRYALPGAFEASINWYRAGGGTVDSAPRQQAPAPEDRLGLPVRVLWPELDPLFPQAFADRLEEFFSDITVTGVDGVGHFTPLEAPREFAALIDTAFRAGRASR